MRMAMFMAVLVFAMTVLCGPVGMAVSTQHQKSCQIRSKTKRANNQDQFRVSNLWRIDKSGECFEDNRHTERYQKYGVEEGAENLGSLPLRLSSVSKQRPRAILHWGGGLTPYVY